MLTNLFEDFSSLENYYYKKISKKWIMFFSWFIDVPNGVTEYNLPFDNIKITTGVNGFTAITPTGVATNSVTAYVSQGKLMINNQNNASNFSIFGIIEII